MNANYHDRIDRTVKRLFSETYNLMSVHCRRTLLMIGGKLGSTPLGRRFRNSGRRASPISIF